MEHLPSQVLVESEHCEIVVHRISKCLRELGLLGCLESHDIVSEFHFTVKNLVRRIVAIAPGVTLVLKVDAHDSGRHHQRVNLFFDLLAEFRPRLPKVILLLEAEPEIRRGAEVASQTQGSVRAHGSLATNDCGNSAVRNPRVLGEAVLGHIQLIEKIFTQNVSRMRKFKRLCLHGFVFFQQLVVIDDPNIVSVASLPAKADPPLLVDSNAVLAFAVSGERFQSVRWRYPKVVEINGLAEHGEFVEGTLLDVLRQTPRTLLIPYLFRFCIRKAFDQFHTIALFPPRVNRYLGFAST
jgi:hypothetical protein